MPDGCMQVNRAASRESCSKKYDEMVNSPSNAGYSQETLYSRAVVLKSATEAVMDMTATPSYQQQPGQLSVELLYSDLPGALALLQEAGELQTVLDWGGAWLRDSATDIKTKDVALALALAHCDCAAMKLEQDADDSLAAVEEMTTALTLLRQYSAGEQLQEDISEALQVSSPPSYCAMLCCHVLHNTVQGPDQVTALMQHAQYIPSMAYIVCTIYTKPGPNRTV